jgi:hypothetical protein
MKFGIVTMMHDLMIARRNNGKQREYVRRAQSLRMTYADLDRSLHGQLSNSGILRLSDEFEDMALPMRLDTRAQEEKATDAPRDPIKELDPLAYRQIKSNKSR